MDDAAQRGVLAGQVRQAGIPGLSAGTSRRGARAFGGDGYRAAAGLRPYRIASLTKPVTAAAVAATLADRGIPLSTPAVALLPALASGWRAEPAITVAQLLGQVSGLRPAVDSQALLDAGIGDGPEAIAAAARLVIRAGSDRDPGQAWAYYNGNYFVAGAILEAVTGLSFEAAVQSSVLAPWGLGRTGFDVPADPVIGSDDGAPVPTGYPRARRPSGGLWSGPADLLAFAERLLTTPALLDEVGRPRTRPGDPMTYGLGWAIGPSGQLYLNGRLPGYRAAFLLSPQHGYASVALASRSGDLPAIASLLNSLQQPLTGDDLAREIDAFAA